MDHVKRLDCPNCAAARQLEMPSFILFVRDDGEVKPSQNAETSGFGGRKGMNGLHFRGNPGGMPAGRE
jgi:hypothetical protein